MPGPLSLVGDLHREAAEIIDIPADGTDAQDRPAFGEDMLRDCLLQLLRRDRLKLLRRAVHFVAAAARSDVDVYHLVFGLRPTPAKIRAAFLAATAAPPSHISDTALTVEYADGEFTTPWAGAPRLVCALNLLAQHLDLDDFQGRIDSILAAADSASSLDAIAKDWADAVDRFRRERSGSAQAARQFRAILEFLETRHPGGTFGSAQVHSGHVLDFWSENAGRDGLDVQRYATAHECFADFVCSLAARAASHAANTAASLSATVAEGGVGDIAADAGHLPGITDREDWLALSDEYAHIKFLTAADHLVVRRLVDLPVEAERLLVSALRAACCADTENRLVEYRRRRREASDSEALLSTLADQGLDYEAAWATCDEVAGRFRDAVLAAAHVLIANRVDDGLMLLLETEGSADVLSAVGELVDSPHDAAPMPSSLGALCDHVFSAMSSGDALPGALQAALSKAERAWRRCNRAGFRRDQRFDSGTVAAMEGAGNRLHGALAHVDRRVGTVARQADEAGGWAGLRCDDTAVVHATLTRLYTAAGNEATT